MVCLEKTDKKGRIHETIQEMKRKLLFRLLVLHYLVRSITTSSGKCSDMVHEKNITFDGKLLTSRQK